MINKNISLEQVRDDIRLRLMTLFEMWERTSDAYERKNIGGQIESFMYLMSSLDGDMFDLLSADRHRRLGVEDWTDEITGDPERD